MQIQMVIVLILSSSLFSVSAKASPDVVSDSELKSIANAAVAKSIATTSMFEAKRCKMYSEVMLGEMRRAKGALSGAAISASHHLDIWNLKISQLREMSDFDDVTDKDAFNHSALGLITNAPANTPETVKVATTELFTVEANRCSTMVSESALVSIDVMNEGSK